MTTDDDIKSKLDAIIMVAADDLDTLDVDSDKYTKTLDNVERLYKLRKTIRSEETTIEPVVDKDRVRFKDFIPLIGSLGGIAIIVVFEAFGHTLTSKATNFVSKPR